MYFVYVLRNPAGRLYIGQTLTLKLGSHSTTAEAQGGRAFEARGNWSW
jgi:predicted GIY-YIG superfamily endonuclease